MSTKKPPLTRIHLLALVWVLLITLNGIWVNAFGTPDSRLSDVFVRSLASELQPDPDIIISIFNVPSSYRLVTQP